MPSLGQLEEFKSSFRDVGNEAAIMANHQLPLEDFELPESEAPAPFPDEWAGGPDLGGDLLRPDDLGLDRPADSFPDISGTPLSGLDDTGAGFDFGDLLGSIPSAPGDLPGVDLPDIPGPDVPDIPGMEGAAAPDLPEDILSGFAADLENGGLPADEPLPEPEALPQAEEPETPPEFPSDLGDLDALGLDTLEPEESEAAAPVEESASPVPAEAAETEFANLEFPDIDLTQAMDMGGEARDGESPADGAADLADLSGAADGGDFNLDGLPETGGLDFPETGGLDTPDFDAAPESGGFDTPDFDAAPDTGMDAGLDALDALDAAGMDDAGAVPAADGGFDIPDFDAPLDLDGLGGDAPDAAAGESAATDDGAGGGFDDVDLSAFDNVMDLGGESPESAPENSDGVDAAAPSGEEDAFDAGMDLPGFEDVPLDLGGDAGAFDSPSGGDEETAGDPFPDLPEDLPEDTSGGGSAADSFDGFSLGGEDWKPPEEALGTPDFDAAAAGDDANFDDFSLAGFDDAFPEPGKAGAAKGAAPGRSAGHIPAPSEEVEEIHLSEGDFKRLQETLSAYPLNLRIACEELIAEQAVAPHLMSALVKLLVRGAPAKETAALAGKILGRTISIPKGYAKQTGAELEAEQASLGYIFVHSFLPVLRLVGAIALVVASLGYLTWRFVVVPFQAERIYKTGYAMIEAGEYTGANEQFRQGFEKHRVKTWFYRYAEAFRDQRQYLFAERKYDELLRVYPRDKKGALDYAAMETNWLSNYEKADRIIRENILDWAINDREGLLALAENNLAWGETEPDKYEDARSAYARLMEQYGRLDPYLEGMLKYFIRTDQLVEVLHLQAHFMSDPKKRKITVPSLAELGGYLLDKRFEESHGAPLAEPPAIPEEYADQIEGIRDVLERAVKADGDYPEPYYHLARYYNRYGSTGEERQSLREALRTFAAAPELSPRRAAYRVDAHRRYAEVLINAGEFFPAEEELVRGIRLYEDARARQVLKTAPQFGRLYADMGDLEFFVKNGDMNAALRFYEEGERNGWAPPEIRYRMGAAHYQNGDWEAALQRFFLLSAQWPGNRRLLYALGNASYLRGNYFAAQGYYNQLMDLLAAERLRYPAIAPGARPEERDLAERVMVAHNNLGVTLEALTRVSGDTGYRGRALGLLSESIRAWDVLTRSPDTMTRMRPFQDLYGPGINLAYLNAQNILRPEPSYEQQIFMRIDRDALEPSPWELLAPRDYRLSDQLLPMSVE